jgi:energy-coupling factor transporter ATP-binding protein EcfA2
MKRKAEVYNIEEQNLIQEHNLIYRVVKDAFDTFFLEKNIREEDVDGIFYVDKRLDELSSNEKITMHWTNHNIPINNITSSQDLQNKIKSNGMVYFLLGRKGSGKSTELVHFAEKYKNNSNVLVIYLDLRTKKTDNDFQSNLHRKIYDEIYEKITLNELAFSKYITEPKYAKQLKPAYKHLSNHGISEIMLYNKKELITSFFDWLKKENKIIYLIFDNVDDWSIKSVQTAIDVCTDFKNKLKVKALIALRDYWTPRNLRLTDKNYASLLLSKPDFFEVINKRLSLAIPGEKDDIAVILLREGGRIELTHNEIKGVYLHLIREIHENSTLQNTLFNLSNCNLREYIKCIFYFFHSVHLNNKNYYYNLLTEKVNAHSTVKYKLDTPRAIQFHDFIEHNMAIHSLCYDTKSSWIFNVFYHTHEYAVGEEFRNSLMFLRIIQNLSRGASRNKDIMIEKLECLGYPKTAIRNAFEKLFIEDFIESPEGVDIDEVTEIYLTIKGHTYLTKVLMEYAYYLYLSDVIPFPNKEECGYEYRVNVIRKYGKGPIGKGDLDEKIKSVLNLIKFLKTEEELEESMVLPTNKKILQQYKQVGFFDMIEKNHILPTIKKLKSTSGFDSEKRKNIGDALIPKLFHRDSGSKKLKI